VKDASPARLPVSAGKASPSAVHQAPTARAYLRNPIANVAMFTPEEMLDAISLLSSILVADNGYRAILAARGAPDGK
jgi:hypothetical protein